MPIIRAEALAIRIHLGRPKAQSGYGAFSKPNEGMRLYPCHRMMLARRLQRQKHQRANPPNALTNHHHKPRAQRHKAATISRPNGLPVVRQTLIMAMQRDLAKMNAGVSHKARHRVCPKDAQA